MATNRTRIAVTIALVLLTVTAGCGGALQGSGGPDSGGDGARPAGGGDGGGDGGSGGDGLSSDASAEAAGQADGGDALAQIRQRQVIFTGRVVLEVDDFEAARRNLSEAARARGGFVSDAKAQLHRVDEQQRYRTGVVVLRVPRENFTALMERVEAGGTVLSTDTKSEDVTDELVDIEARLSSLRAERDRLRTLFERANETEDVLAVERRLSEVQTEIERLEGRQQSLQRQVAYSTITVELREERPEPETEQWYDVGPLAAFLEAVDGVIETVRAVAVGLAYALPYLLAFGIPLGAIAFVARRRL